MTVYAPEAPARAVKAVKRATRRTQTTVRPLELFDADTLAGLRPNPMLARLGLLDPRWWFTATDLFCGAGGTTTGFEAAMIDGQNIVDTLQVVNHDWLAIASHQANHAAARHFIEDITKLDASLLVKTSLLWASLECTNFSNAKGGQSRDADSRSLAEHMERYIRAVNPLYFCVENVREFMSWGPLEHKKDKHGRPMFRSVKKLAQRHSKTGEPLFSAKSGKPLTQQVVDAGGNLVFEQVPVMVPESRTKGRDFIRWKQSIEDLGYTAHHTLLNSADYGERTSRIRLFMVFAKKGLPVRWPRATHSNPRKKGGLTVGTEPWLPVRPCLDLEVKGRSIFDRVRLDKKGNVKLDKKGNPIPAPLVEKTLKRLFAGLCQYIAGSNVPTVTKQLQALAEALLSGKTGGSQQAQEQAETEWLAKRTSNPPSGKSNPGASLGQPGPAVACGFHPELVQVEGQPVAEEFITKAFSGNPAHLVQGTGAPAGSLTCVDHHQLGQVVPVAGEFLTTRHHTDPECRGRSLNQPAAVVMPNDNHELAQVVPNADAEHEFVTQYNGGSDECRNLSVKGPVNTITLANRFGVVQTVAQESEFLTNPGWPERCSGASTGEPGPTLIARQDKAPLSLVQAVGTGEVGFVQKYYSSGDNVTSLNDPSGALTCTDRMALAQVEANEPAEGAWLDKRFGSGEHNHQSLSGPGGAILTNDHHVLAQVEPVAEFLDQQFGASGPASVQHPAGSITGTPKLNLAQVESAEPWIVKTDFNRVGTGMSEPSGALTASRHHPYLAQTEPVAQPEGEWLLDNKFDNTGRPLSDCGPTLLTGDHQYLAQTEAAPVAVEPKNWQFQDGDSETMRLIRLFLRAYNQSDVLLRMLMVKELLAIQGFPADYVLKGSSTDKKKFVGNSVPPKMSQRITEALYEALQEAGMLDRLTEYTGSLVVTKKGRLAESGGRLAIAA
jgi:DNA (cytosine-5)-methyltransferase 1